VFSIIGRAGSPRTHSDDDDRVIASANIEIALQQVALQLATFPS
jgi:hypothetical protein